MSHKIPPIHLEYNWLLTCEGYIHDTQKLDKWNVTLYEQKDHSLLALFEGSGTLNQKHTDLLKRWTQERGAIKYIVGPEEVRKLAEDLLHPQIKQKEEPPFPTAPNMPLPFQHQGIFLSSPQMSPMPFFYYFHDHYIGHNYYDLGLGRLSGQKNSKAIEQEVQQFKDFLGYIGLRPFEGNEKSLIHMRSNYDWMKRHWIGKQHQHLDAFFMSLEQICISCGSEKDIKAVQFVRLSNQMLYNLRLVAESCDSFRKIQKTAGTAKAAATVAGSLGTIQPILASIVIGAQLYAMVKSTDQEELPPLSEKAFFDVINEGLMPVLREQLDVTTRGIGLLADKMDEQASHHLVALNTFQKELLEELGSSAKQVDQQFASQAMNTFVRQAQVEIEIYRSSLIQVKEWIQNEDDDSKLGAWFADYLKATQELLKNARQNRINGFHGGEPIVSIAEGAKKPIYITGLLHYQLAGNMKFPPQLPLLDSAAFTFLLCAKKIIDRDVSLTSKEKRLLEVLVGQLLEGVRAQQTLLDQVLPQLDALIEAHKKMMEGIQDRIKQISTARRESYAQRCHTYSETELGRLQETLVGRDMFYWSELLTKRLRFEKRNDEIAQTMKTRERYNMVTNPNLIIDRVITFPIRGKSFFHCNAVHEKMVLVNDDIRGRNIKDLTNAVLSRHGRTDVTYFYRRAKLIRELWFDTPDDMKTAVRVSVMGAVPVIGSIYYDYVPVEENPTRKEASPLLSCTLTWEQQSPNVEGDEDEKVTVRFERESFLKREDLQGFPTVDRHQAGNREELMQDILQMMDPTRYDHNHNPLRVPFRQAETIFPLKEGGVAVHLPKNQVVHLVQILCPELFKVFCVGGNVEHSCTFERKADGFYHLYFHLSYQRFGRSLPYIKRKILIVDETTVESFRKQKREARAEQTHFQEFLYCMLFGNHYEHEGMPDSKTYVKGEGYGIVAPHLTPFPGLFEIFKAFPYLCFRFDHKDYNEAARDALVQALQSGKIDGASQGFFVKTENEVDPENYPEVQTSLRRAVKETEKMQDYQKFQEKYEIFMALAGLVSNHKQETLMEALVKEAHIMPPSQMGSLEQALYYEPPSSKAVGRIGAMLKDQPSLSHHRLREYERQLTLVQKYFQTDSASFEEQGRKEFVNQLGFPNQRKTRAHIEEDMKEETFPEMQKKKHAK